MIIDDFLIRLLLAALLGGLIGLEREIYHRAAGLRTNLLVSMGSCLITLVAMHLFQTELTPDASRIPAQIISGIGFLGAGTIMKNGDSIKGLTTAACLWISAAIGMAIGYGCIEIALFATIVALLVLMILGHLERFVHMNGREQNEL